MTYPYRLRSEIRLIRTEQYTKRFAYGIALFTAAWFAAHFIMGGL